MRPTSSAFCERCAWRSSTTTRARASTTPDARRDAPNGGASAALSGCAPSTPPGGEESDERGGGDASRRTDELFRGDSAPISASDGSPPQDESCDGEGRPTRTRIISNACAAAASGGGGDGAAAGARSRGAARCSKTGAPRANPRGKVARREGRSAPVTSLGRTPPVGRAVGCSICCAPGRVDPARSCSARATGADQLVPGRWGPREEVEEWHGGGGGGAAAARAGEEAAGDVPLGTKHPPTGERNDF